MDSTFPHNEIPTQPCPPPGYERPTFEEMKAMFAIGERESIKRVLRAFGWPETTHGTTTMGVQIAEETR